MNYLFKFLRSACEAVSKTTIFNRSKIVNRTSFGILTAIISAVFGIVLWHYQHLYDNFDLHQRNYNISLSSELDKSAEDSIANSNSAKGLSSINLTPKIIQDTALQTSPKLSYFLKSNPFDEFDNSGLALKQNTSDLKLRLFFYSDRIKKFEISGAPEYSNGKSSEYTNWLHDNILQIETNFLLLPSTYELYITDIQGNRHRYNINLCYSYNTSAYGFDQNLWSNSNSTFVHITSDGVQIDPPTKKSVNTIVFKKRFTSGLKAKIVLAPESKAALFSINLSDKVSLVFGEDGKKGVKLRIAKIKNGKLKSINCLTRQLSSEITVGQDISVVIERINDRLIVTNNGTTILEYKDSSLVGGNIESFRSVAICNWRKGGPIIIKAISIEGIQ